MNDTAPLAKPADDQSSEDSPPSLDLLIEAAKSVIGNGVLWPEMSDFVEIVSQIELYRLSALELGRNLFRAKARFSSGNSESQIRDALDDERHDELRSRYLSMMMSIKRSVIVRRLRRQEVEEAETAYAKYWPRNISLQHHEPSPFSLIVTSMSANERSDLAAEAISIHAHMKEIKSWCSRHPSFTAAMFDARFSRLIDKKWVRVTIRWIDDVWKVVKEISDCTQQ